MEIEALKADGYFAHPYHSWERGLNESTNGLIPMSSNRGLTHCSVLNYHPLGTISRSLIRWYPPFQPPICFAEDHLKTYMPHKKNIV